MKRIILHSLIALSLGALVSCGIYDDTELRDQIDDLKIRMDKLEDSCNKMNSDISSLKTALDALQKGDFITSVSEIYEGEAIVGYTITFANSGKINIFNGKDGAPGKDGEQGAPGKDGKDGRDGKDGKDGKDGRDGQGGSGTPDISVVLGQDGRYYWTINGEMLLDADGNPVPASGKDGKDGERGIDGRDGRDGERGVDGRDGEKGEKGDKGDTGVQGENGITPQLKIENGRWYYSIDYGRTWIDLGVASGEGSGDCIIKDIVVVGDSVEFYLNDRSYFTVPMFTDLRNYLYGTWYGVVNDPYGSYTEITLIFEQNGTFTDIQTFHNPYDTSRKDPDVHTGSWTYYPEDNILMEYSDDFPYCYDILQCTTNRLVLNCNVWTYYKQMAVTFYRQ